MRPEPIIKLDMYYLKSPNIQANLYSLEWRKLVNKLLTPMIKYVHQHSLGQGGCLPYRYYEETDKTFDDMKHPGSGFTMAIYFNLGQIPVETFHTMAVALDYYQKTASNKNSSLLVTRKCFDSYMYRELSYWGDGSVNEEKFVDYSLNGR